MTYSGLPVPKGVHHIGTVVMYVPRSLAPSGKQVVELLRSAFLWSYVELKREDDNTVEILVEAPSTAIKVLSKKAENFSK